MKLKYRLRARHPMLFNLLWSVKKIARSVLVRLKNAIQIDKGTGVFDLASVFDVAKHHGMFDLNYYNEHQGTNFADELEAFSDFMHKSRFSNVNPSPAFDTEMYMKCNTDIYHDGINPLEHYLSHGRHEGRWVLPASPRWTPSDNLGIEKNTNISIDNIKIAVCLHIFYSDFVDYFKLCLDCFPVSVDLFITVSNDQIKDRSLLEFEKLSSVKALDVRVVPNRGRNFGPLLVEFGDKLLEYDLLCHLHSKKSLYSGRSQTQWAEYLGEYLLRDKYVVKKAIAAFESDPECGIFYPTSFWMMPDWVNHWLKNKRFGWEYANEWGLKANSNFLCYPVGGMFWARPKALYQLLERNHDYSDFPDEPLPSDGSKLHGLERMLGLLAENNGYKQLFYYPPLGRFTYDKTWIFSNYIRPADSLAEITKDLEIISFDVFDTLLQREFFFPDYAKLKLGKYLMSVALIDDAEVYVQKRNHAEYSIREKHQFKGDVSIYEVYDLLASQFGWDAQEAKKYAEMEFAFDLDMVQPKNEMVSLANQLMSNGVEVWIISDTYYSLEQVALMLRKIGLVQSYQLFVSSDMGCRKDNGQMWIEIVKKLKSKGITNMASYLHVGDNVVADAQIPGDMGLGSLHILNPIDKWQAGGFECLSEAFDSLDEKMILKWGPLITRFGRYPFLGE